MRETQPNRDAVVLPLLLWFVFVRPLAAPHVGAHLSHCRSRCRCAARCTQARISPVAMPREMGATFMIRIYPNGHERCDFSLFATAEHEKISIWQLQCRGEIHERARRPR